MRVGDGGRGLRRFFFLPVVVAAEIFHHAPFAFEDFVLEHTKLSNEETGADFHWFLVRSADATFDILADPELVPVGIATGMIVQIGCLFFGRIVG